jgi:tripartite-type tricarboxylate transporter receptor subunit TctC
MRNPVVASITALAFFAFPGQGDAQQPPWPTKALRLVIGNAPGSTPDIIARSYSEGMKGALGQPMTVENRPGADGIIAATAVARADPDGYVLLVGSQQLFAISPHTHKSLPVNTERDFSPIAAIIDSTLGNSVVVHSSLPIRTVQELITHAKAHPDKLTYSTSVANQSLFMAWFKRRAGIEMREVRYKDTNMAMQDGLAGRIDLTVNSHFGMIQGLKSGQFRLLSTAASKRFADHPDVPTIAEIFPDYNMDGFFILMGPAGLPKAIVERLNRDTDAVVKGQAFQEVSRRILWGNTKGAQTPEAAAALIRAQSEVYRQLVKDIGLTAQ